MYSDKNTNRCCLILPWSVHALQLQLFTNNTFTICVGCKFVDTGGTEYKKVCRLQNCVLAVDQCFGDLYTTSSGCRRVFDTNDCDN